MIRVASMLWLIIASSIVFGQRNADERIGSLISYRLTDLGTWKPESKSYFQYDCLKNELNSTHFYYDWSKK